MTRRCFVGVLPATVMTIVILGPPGLVRLGADDAERRFLQSVEEYMTLRQQIDRHVPAIQLSDDMDSIQRAADMRLAAIQHLRARAQAGDIFNAAVVDLFRSRIQHGFATRRHGAAELIDEITAGGERWRPAEVNGRFSWRTAAATPPYVISVLPDLPAALQYRFVGPDLVLVDITASCILDVLRGVLEIPPQRDGAQ